MNPAKRLVAEVNHERGGVSAAQTDCSRDQLEFQGLGRRRVVAQRALGIALGYEDLNDHETLRDDAVLALASGKRDVMGAEPVRERDRGRQRGDLVRSGPRVSCSAVPTASRCAGSPMLQHGRTQAKPRPAQRGAPDGASKQVSFEEVCFE